MSRLSLAFLGRPEVRHAERVLKFPTRKTLALLVYLAVEGGFHTREKLTALFWPESNGPQGRAVLRNTLSYLRSALLEAADPATDQAPGQELHLLVEYNAIGFASDSEIELDLHCVEAAVRSTQTKGLAHHELLAQLQAAVALYRGNFLEGLSLSDTPTFDDWVSIQREYCHRQVNTAFDQLAHLQAEGGEMRAALDTATRWLAHFPLQEDACQQVMSLHFQVGDRSAALRAYETYHTMVAKELEMEPGPEMVALAERIRSEPPLSNEGSRSALLEWLTGLEQDVRTVQVGVGTLSAEESMCLVLAFAQEVTPQTQGRIPLLSPSRTQVMERMGVESGIERFSQWLFDQTHGQPLYIVETLKSLLERGLFVPQLDKNGGWSIDFAAALDNEHLLQGFLPSRVRELISLRLTRLSIPATEFLIAASILCYDCTFEYLSRIANLGENEGLRALDEVMKSRLLMETAHLGRESGSTTYSFAHHKIREVVYVEAGDARRRIFHQRALDALRALFVPAAILAYHAQAAGLMDAAFHYLLIAADDAMRLFAISDAITIYEQAQQFMHEYSGEKDGQTNISLSEQCHLYVQLGEAYELNGELEKARTMYSEMLTCAKAHSEPEMECATLNRLATVTAHDAVNVVNVAKALQIAESNN